MTTTAIDATPDAATSVRTTVTAVVFSGTDDADLESVLAALDGHAGKDLLVIADETGLRVLEVDRRR